MNQIPLRYMLDTNIVIHVIKRRPVELVDTFNHHHGRLAISSITLAELLYGAEKSLHQAKNLKAIEDFTSRLQVISYDSAAAAHYGQIRALLEEKGTLIGPNNLHIAAHARSRGMTLVSNNLREFKRVPGLLQENWIM